MTAFDPTRKQLSLLGVSSQAGTPQRARAVTDTDWMKSISDPEMQSLGQSSPPRLFIRGERVYRRGDSAANLYIPLEGQVKLTPPSWWRAHELVTGTRGKYRVNIRRVQTLIKQLEPEALA